MGLLDAFRPPPPIRRNTWNGYTYRFRGDQRCVVSFDVQACDPRHQATKYTGRRVIAFAAANEVGPSGMPSQAAFERMHVLERELCSRLSAAHVACWHVGTQTYNGLRELIFEVVDVIGFEAIYAEFAAGRGDLKLVPFDGWKFFNEKIRPGVVGHNHISNREVIEQLRAAGAHLPAVHALDHQFLGGSVALEQIERLLLGKGFRRTAASDGSLTMTQQAPLDDQDLIDTATLFLRDLAHANGAQYDGWGAAVVRPN